MKKHTRSLERHGTSRPTATAQLGPAQHALLTRTASLRRLAGVRAAFAAAVTVLFAAVGLGCAGTWVYTAEQAPCARQCMIIQNQCTGGAALNQDPWVRLGALIDCNSQRNECYQSCGMVQQ